MKTHLIVAFMVSSILFSFVDVEEYNSTSLISYNSEFSIEGKCGFSTFSESVKSSFFHASNLNNYEPSQIYLTKAWTIVLANPYCNYNFAELSSEFSSESYRSSSILNGTWSLTYQTGDLAFTDLSEAKESGYVSLFYPLIERQRDLKFEPNDPNYTSGEQWYLDNYGQNGGTSGIDLNTQGAWDNYNGNGISIGVIDDGVDHQHPDLSPNYISQSSFDYCGNDTDAAPDRPDENEEIDSHGTAVSGIVAGKGNNSIGIAGVAYEANIIGIRLVAANCTSDYSSDEAEALALNHRLDLVDIYTNSWGPGDDGSTLGEVGPLTLAAFEKGISEGRDGLGSIYTWANGNGRGNFDQSNKDAYANSRYTIAVGALNWQGEQTSYSEAGSNLLVSAPSHNKYDYVDPAIFTTDVSGVEGSNSTDYMPSMGGTSAATPMVAGVVALMLEANPNLTWRDVQHILVKTSKKVDHSHPGWSKTYEEYDYNHAYGYGLVDATAAVNMAEDWETIGEEIVVNTGEKRVDKNIFDKNDVGVSSTITVNESINIESVEIHVNITHDYRGDLNFFLTSPNGVVSELVRAHGDPGFHYRNWTFTSVVHWDENSFGDWTLKVNDTVGEGSGDFNTWNLTFYGSSSPDSDNDNLSDYAEIRIGTWPNTPDSDNDGILDGDEFYGWEDLLGNIHKTHPRNVDTDNDLLSDSEEGYNYTGYITDPNDNDTDDDGLLDGDEVLGTVDNRFYVTNPLSVDTDNDTLDDFNEIFAYLIDLPGSDPTKLDSDNDTMPDPYELEKGFNPMIQTDASLDSDFDGFDRNFNGFLEESEYYTNAMEYVMGTDPHNQDSDLDGMHDGWEYYWGLNPLSDDSQDDFDNDTLTNIYEYDNMLVESTIFSLSDSNLRGYWKLDGINEYSLIDITGKGNGGGGFGEPQRVSGIFNKGMYCNGVNTYGKFDSFVSEKLTEYTVQGWVNLTNFTEDFATFFGTATDGRTWLGINSENFFEFRVHSGNKLYSTPITNDSISAKLGVWYHIAATYSETSDSMKLYVNGTLVSNETLSPTDSIDVASSNNYMCRGQNGEYLNGTIDNIAVWNREFSSDEVRYVFEQPLGFNDFSSLKVEDGILRSNPSSKDTDGDMISDAEEFYFGIDGYITDATNPDTDNDGLSDYNETMIMKTSPIKNDTDDDGFDDLYTFVLNITSGLRLNQTGDCFPLNPLEWNDTDGDGFGDNSDAFPYNSSEWSDLDEDGLGSNIEEIMGTSPESNDTDNDGISDFYDVFPLDSTESEDTDGDGVGDNSDDCPEDGRGQNDTDEDGFCDSYDAFPNNPLEWSDEDKDGYGDNSDLYPNDSNRYSDPLAESETAQPISGQSMDSALIVVLALGGVYFIFKYFVRKL